MTDVMDFRSKIQEWYTKLGRSSPVSPHSIRCAAGGAEVEPVVSIPILSPVSSPQSNGDTSTSAPLQEEKKESVTARVGEGEEGASMASAATAAVLHTPEAERRRTSLDCDSDGFPPTPKISATPSTCDVLGLKKKQQQQLTEADAEAEEAFCRTPEFPVLTPAGLRASEKKFGLDSLSISSNSEFNSPRTPNLDSTPTTTIQLSPSHFVLDEALEGAGRGDHSDTSDENSIGGLSPLGSSLQNRQNITNADLDVEEKLMNSLYIGSFSTQKSSKKTHKTHHDQQLKHSGISSCSGKASKKKAKDRSFDIEVFPAVFRKGNASVELEGVYRKVQKLETLRDQDVTKIFPNFEKERANLLLEVLSSRNYIECVKNSQGTSWKVSG